MASQIKIMGIVNVNDDSFFKGSRVSGAEQFMARVEKLFDDGADVIDIGACSSRPGSTYPGVEEEWRRLKPVLQVVHERFATISGSQVPKKDGFQPCNSAAKEFDCQTASPLANVTTGSDSKHYIGPRFSIDTFSSEIVQRTYDTIGPFIVNDITAGQSDAGLLPLVAKLDLPYIAMHNLNPPAIAGQRRWMLICKKEGENVVENVKRFFRTFEKRAATAGISDWILDAGYGFGKDVEQNLELLERQDELLSFGREILAGISRKRMAYERLGTKPEDAETLLETRRLQNIAIERGATWIRCHDVQA